MTPEIPDRKLVSAIDYYDGFAPSYDELAERYEWFSPQIMFGMLSDLIPDRPTVVDVGIGTGLSSVPFKRINARIVGIDGSRTMLQYCRARGLAQDLYCLDFSSGNFPMMTQSDVVISNGVFYFLRDIDSLFRSCASVIAHGGYFAVNFESTVDNLQEAYANFSNADLIQETPVANTGVVTYRHNPSLYHHLALECGLSKCRHTRYYAYTSPQTGRSVYFDLCIWRRP